ncbi:hypothetical protein OSTOST_00827, partial [Ostertagia ostertagi]
MIMEETQTDDVPLMPMDVEVIQEDIDNLQENEQILEDTALLEGELALVQRRLHELSREQTCRPRSYEVGVDRDEKICHVFIILIRAGKYQLVAARQESLDRKKQCTMCLEEDCEKDSTCRKYGQ